MSITERIAEARKALGPYRYKDIEVWVRISRVVGILRDVETDAVALTRENERLRVALRYYRDIDDGGARLLMGFAATRETVAPDGVARRALGE